MAFDVATVGCEHDEGPLGTVVVEPFDELTALLGHGVRQRRVRRRGRDHGGELVVGAEASPTAQTGADDELLVLVAALADREQGKLGRPALDADLLPDGDAECVEQPCIDRTVLAPSDEVVLRRQCLV